MNAYELAKYIEDDIQIQEGIADMLRQQADRIAELEKDLHMVQRHYDQLNSNLKCKTEKFWSNTPSFADEHKFKPVDNTHSHKQLSDEEIYRLASETASKFDGSVHVLRFARAIIKEITN